MTVDEVPPAIVEEAVKDSRHSTGRRIVLVLIVMCVIMMIATALLAWRLFYTPTQRQAQAGTDLAAQVKAACTDPKQNTATLKNLCDDATQIVDDKPSTVEGPKGDTGETGPPPSDAQVSKAVELYCSVNSCRGAKGASATQAQVAEAVASYCDAQGQCRGPEGAAGSTGQSGAKGDQGERGENGSGPTDAQVASAVAAYCSTRDGCQGPAGEQGDQGPAGQDGKPGDTVDGGSCQFTGIGTLTITIQTSNGPTTFECVGSPLGDE